MVERPIKKSERQAISQTAESVVEETGVETAIDPNGNGSDGVVQKREVPKPIRSKDRNRDQDQDQDQADRGDRADRADRGDRGDRGDRERGRGDRDRKGKGKGKGRRGDDEVARVPANMALMRGPRPVRPTTPEEAPPEELETSEGDNEAIEATDTTAESTDRAEASAE